MPINTALAENMTAKELFSCIELLDTNLILPIIPIFLKKVQEVLIQNDKLKELEVKIKEYKELENEIAGLEDKLDRISHLCSY